MRLSFLFILFSTVSCFSQANKFNNSHTSNSLDSIGNYLARANNWTSYSCPQTMFLEEQHWSRPFQYSYSGHSYYPFMYISNSRNTEWNRICLDTLNMAIYFPLQDVGGPSKASGVMEKFSLYLRNIQEIEWTNTSDTILMELTSHTDTGNMIGEYTRESYCNNLKFELFNIFIRFSKKEVPANFPEKFEELLKKLGM